MIKPYRIHRVANLDWIDPLMRLACERHWRIFLLGAEPGVGDKAAANLTERFPGLQITAEHGFFNRNSEENEQVLERIRAYKPVTPNIAIGECCPVERVAVRSDVNRCVGHR